MVVGDTECVPAATGVTEPMLWSIENEVELVVVHDSVEELPVCIEVGLAVKTQVGGGGVVVTVTVAVQVLVPPAPVAVPVKVVVVVSAPVETDPAPTGVTLPMVWSIEKLEAPDVVQESVEWSPVCTDVGEAESAHVTGGGVVVTVTVAVQVFVPPAPVAVPVKVVVVVSAPLATEPEATGVWEPSP